uniref:Pentraxin 3, long b n=1 Tax=Echeneis naucrates TaxID=173247 RepID=A0A665W293_ECHNA
NVNQISVPDIYSHSWVVLPPSLVLSRQKTWDKLFSMLENSQMRENMLLQYADDIIKVEMGLLRGEMLRLVGRRKAPAAAGNSFSNSKNLEGMLQQLLSAAQSQASRLTKLEANCFSGPGAGTGMNAKAGFQIQDGGSEHRVQEVTSQEAALDAVLATLQQMNVELKEVLTSSRQRYLPAGNEMALLFPMRSRRIYTSVIPDVPLSIASFTVCLWAKPTTVANKTVLFSYGNRRNPYEIQLLLSQTTALFTIGGEAHLVEARGVVKQGEWIHLCGAWSSNQGLATLWAGGKKVASTPGVAEGHVLPDGGSLQLGQERNGFEEGFDPKLAFAGKMTGVNMWDRVLSEEEISQLALQKSEGFVQRGNVVAWGVTEMVPHGGAQFIF